MTVWEALYPDVLHAALEAASGAITIADMRRPGRPLIFVNQAFVAMTGYSRSEVLGRNCSFLQGPATDPQAIAAMREAFASKRDIQLLLTNYRKDGTPFRNMLRLSPVLCRASGECLAYIGLQFDITEEEEMQARRGREQKFAALGEMISGVAHEINNLLQPILLLSDLLQTDARLAPTPDLRQQLATIQDSATAAREIVRDILIYAGNREAVPDRPTPFAASLKRALSVAEKLLPERIRLETTLSDDLAGESLLGTTQLAQILTNLMRNSIDAISGTGTLSLAAARTRVTDPLLPHMATDAPYFVLTVQDTGCGIPPELRERIFDPFFTTKSLASGSGLGLAVIYGLLRHVGGGITVSSTPGTGTTFTLYIPVILPPANPDHA